ncbi:MAG TPA: ABC transporter ATP-binding protein [Micromonosporaceae bacterium]|nr:ABC transporter ATP-binding protein [Micromonosporaceae bacterium]
MTRPRHPGRGGGPAALARLLATHLRRYAGPVALVTVLELAQTLAILYLPTLNADLIDNGVLRGDSGHVLRTGGLMLAVTLPQVGCLVTAAYLAARTAAGLGRDLRAAVFCQVLACTDRELGRFGTASLVTRTTNDVQQVQTLVLLGLTQAVSAPVMCLGGVAMALRQDVPLSALLLVSVPVLAAVAALVLHRVRPLFRAAQERIDMINRLLREQVTGVRVIRAFDRDAYEQQRFARANAELARAATGAGRLVAVLGPAVLLVVNASSAAVLWYGGHRADAGSLGIGELVAFLTYLAQILGAVMMATSLLMAVPRAEACAGRIAEILRTEPGIRPPARPVRRLGARGRLELRSAGFHYPGAEAAVLHDVDLLIGPGGTTGVVGSTGSGKSTLLRLAPRLLAATSGAVLVGGVDVRDLEPALLAATVGLVPQRPYLFAGTVRANLCYGRPDATDTELWHALAVAQARTFVERLPEGLDSPVTQGGGNLSGGQRQRLAVARALVHRPDIYLFDDAFSALDNATEAALRAALARQAAGATVVIAAQRVRTIRHADRIVVLDGGRVAGVGTHQELAGTNRIYQEIVTAEAVGQPVVA